MDSNYWRKWLKFAGMRALKTFAQTAVATVGVSTAMAEVNWLLVGSASLLAAVLSLLTSVAGLPELPEPEYRDEEDYDGEEGRDGA